MEPLVLPETDPNMQWSVGGEGPVFGRRQGLEVETRNHLQMLATGVMAVK